MVMVKKGNNKWRMCIDFTNLNKACTKDEFPLPRIESLVDVAITLELMILLDFIQGIIKFGEDKRWNQKAKPIYFVSKVLGPSKRNYLEMEKVLYALLMASRKL